VDYKCPVCGRVIPSSSLLPEGKRQINAMYYPFCSDRCRLVDLGAWLHGDYRIASGPCSSAPEVPDELNPPE
jgi:endogenous inhibitor of DNA gyrase (YacG/DUF329 family)